MHLKKISIVVPVKNGLATLPNFIKGVKNQSLFKQTEVVVIDSGSTDGSVEFLAQFDFVKVLSIDPKAFNHGATRNLAVTHCKGQFVLMTVQDAVPVDPTWLEDFVSHFKEDTVTAVCGQQVVPHHRDKNPHEWFRPQSSGTTQTVQFKNREAFLALSPKEQRAVCGWDDVNAMYRKQALLDLPFQPLMFGEDMLWAKMALEKGFKLVYDYRIRVFHYHYQFPKYTYKRTLISKFFIFKCFNFVDTRTYSLKAYALVLYRNVKWNCAPKWILHNFKLIYHHRKATKALVKAQATQTIDVLEKELTLHIPIGKQKTVKE